MIYDFERLLGEMGYGRVPVNLSNPQVFVKLTEGSRNDDENEGYVTVIVDECENTAFSAEQFENISRQIRRFLMNKSRAVYHFLYIIASRDKLSPERLLNGLNNYWLIDPSGPRLVSGGNVDPMFMGLMAPIERLIGADARKERKQGGASPRGEAPVNQINPLKSPVNLAVVAVNVLVFLITDITSEAAWEQIVEKYSLSWRMVFGGGQFYRVITCMFLHDGIDHIFNNMLVLLFVGSCIEQVLGRTKYLIAYFSSGVIAGFTSMVYNMLRGSYAESIGASGAIFGMMGSLAFILFAGRGKLHNLDMGRVAFMIIISLYGGFANAGVDNAAHIGGFIGGVAVTALLCRGSKRKAEMG